MKNTRRTGGSTLVDIVYRKIKNKILSNEFPLGYQALEQEIAALLGVSRTPVREALIRLDKEGLVELIPRRGMYVRPLVPDDMREIYEVLTCLESTAAELLARRKPGKAVLAPMERAIDAMDTALARDDLDSWAEADAEFHNALLQLCGNRRLAEFAETVRDQGHRARLATLRLRPRPTRSNVDHRAVLNAIRSGDWRKARNTHEAHRKRASEMLMKMLSAYRLSHL